MASDSLLTWFNFGIRGAARRWLNTANETCCSCTVMETYPYLVKYAIVDAGYPLVHVYSLRTSFHGNS